MRCIIAGIMKTIDYFDNRIESLKATIKRLQAERRIAILRQRERFLKQKANKKRKGGTNGR